MLWLHCSLQALVQSGCNCHYPKRQCLTLAMQIFSSNSATYFHQQVCFCSARTLTEPLSAQSYTTAELTLQEPVLQGPAPSSLILLSPVISPSRLQTALAWQLHVQKAKPAANHVLLVIFCLFLFASLGKPTPNSEKKIPKTNIPFPGNWINLAAHPTPSLTPTSLKEEEKPNRNTTWFVLTPSPHQ